MKGRDPEAPPFRRRCTAVYRTAALEPAYQRIRDTSWTTRAVFTPVNVVVS